MSHMSCRVGALFNKNKIDFSSNIFGKEQFRTRLGEETPENKLSVFDIIERLALVLTGGGFDEFGTASGKVSRIGLETGEVENGTEVFIGVNVILI